MPPGERTAEKVVKDLKGAIAAKKGGSEHFFMLENNLKDFLGEYHELEQHWNVSADNPVTAPGKVWGKPLIFAKKVVRRLLRWYINSFVDRQRYFNLKVTHSFNRMRDLFSELDDFTRQLQRERDELKEQLAEISELAGQNRDRWGEANEKLDTMAERVNALEGRFSEMEGRFSEKAAQLTRQQEGILGQIEQLNAKEEQFISRLEELFCKVSDHTGELKRLQEKDEARGLALQQVEGSLDSHGEQLAALHMQSDTHDTLLDHLEQQASAAAGMLEHLQNQTGRTGAVVDELKKQLSSELAVIADRMRRVERYIQEGRQEETDKPSLEQLAESDRLKQGDLDYYLFESRFRGSRETIKQRQERYLKYFKGKQKVLDLGCGRGEFVELLLENSTGVSGVDLNDDMVGYCRERGLPVVQGDLLSYLNRLPDGELDGIFTAQVIEHLVPEELVRLLNLSRRKLKATGVMVLETINPLSIKALTESFYLDLSHQKPVHPEALRFLLQAEGFSQIELSFFAPADECKIPPLDPGEGNRDNIEKFNAAVEHLNTFLYGPREYAAVVVK